MYEFMFILDLKKTSFYPKFVLNLVHPTETNVNKFSEKVSCSKY